MTQRHTILYLTRSFIVPTTKIGALTEAAIHLSVYCVNLKPLAQKRCILELLLGDRTVVLSALSMTLVYCAKRLDGSIR